MLRGMWDLPGPGIEPVSPALAGRFLTKSPNNTFLIRYPYLDLRYCVQKILYFLFKKQTEGEKKNWMEGKKEKSKHARKFITEILASNHLPTEPTIKIKFQAKITRLSLPKY